MLNYWRTAWERLEQGVLPVARWEMRSLMRGNRAPVALFLCTGLAILFGLLTLQLRMTGSAPSPEVMVRLGRSLFTVIVLLQAGLAVLLAPLLAGGLIAREYQQQTLENQVLTRLTGMEIAWGKLVACLAFFMVVVVCTLPVLAVAFVLGGVSPWELFGSQCFVLGLAVYYGAAGLHYTARYRRLYAAVPAAWFSTLFMLFMILPFQFSIFTIVFIISLGSDRSGLLQDRVMFGCLGRNILVSIYMILATGILLPTLIIFSWTSFNPPVVLIVLLNHEGLGDIFTLAAFLWWLVPFLSAAMLAYGAHTMLEDAAVTIEKMGRAE